MDRLAYVQLIYLICVFCFAVGIITYMVIKKIRRKRQLKREAKETRRSLELLSQYRDGEGD